jgi:SAM-dependent methyltransferase
MKDYFSDGSDNYALYRPSYPDAFFAFVRSLLPNTAKAWDCGTGNGQVAAKLAPFFDAVYATDISQSQLDNAVQLKNIHYSQQPAEQTNFPADFFDFIIVGQAIHWFDFERFYAEATRTAKNGAIISIIGYGKLMINGPLDTVINHLYSGILRGYWPAERRYIDEQYNTIPFLFPLVDTPGFSHKLHWTFEQLCGYLQTWSAVKQYSKAHQQNPVDMIYDDLRAAWGTALQREVSFPMLVKLGKIDKAG